jgi:hypothetical protein
MSSKVRLTDKKFNEVYNFINKYVDRDAAAAFNSAYKQEREIEWLNKFWNKLEEYTPWTNTYTSIEDLTASPDKVLEQIYNKNPEYDKISEARMKNILDNNDITEEQLKAYYKFRKEQSDAIAKFNEDRYKAASDEYSQIERSKDDSYYNSPLANEYAREAYIKGNKDDALLHEIAGKAAGVADFTPFPVSLAGPILRTAQKVYADKPALTAGTAADFAGAIIPDVAEKPARMAYNYGKSFIERLAPRAGDSKIMKALEARVNAADASKLQDIAKNDLNIMNTNLDMLTDKQLLDIYDKVSNPAIKSKLEAYFNARGKRAKAQAVLESDMVQSNNAAKRLAQDNIKQADDAVNAANADFIKTSAQELPTTELKAGIQKVEPFVDDNVVSYFGTTPLSTLSEYYKSKVQPSKVADVLYNSMLLSGRKAARSGIGGRLGQLNTFDATPTDNSDKIIKDVISMYSKEWSPTNVPANYNEPLIKAAYDTWRNDLMNRSFYEAEWRSK